MLIVVDSFIFKRYRDKKINIQINKAAFNFKFKDGFQIVKTPLLAYYVFSKTSAVVQTVDYCLDFGL